MDPSKYKKVVSAYLSLHACYQARIAKWMRFLPDETDFFATCQPACYSIQDRLVFLPEMVSCAGIYVGYYSQGRLRNRSLISGGQMQIKTQFTLSPSS